MAYCLEMIFMAYCLEMIFMAYCLEMIFMAYCMEKIFIFQLLLQTKHYVIVFRRGHDIAESDC
jgi:hypothetical protein